MLQDLKYLTAAVAKKDFVEALCHFHIEGGKAWAYDGVMSMETPLKMDVDVRPHASSFIRAIAACDDDTIPAMHVTPTGRLSIKSGKFRAFVECLDPEKVDFPIPKPSDSEMEVEITEPLLDSIKTLAPLMSIDASRPWAQGLRIVGNSTYVTNNIILAEYWHGSNFPYEIIVPADFVKAMITINQKPIRARVTPHALTFYFENDRWLRTQLVVGKWPENLDKLFKIDKTQESLSEDFFKALEKLKPFLDEYGRVYIFPDRLATSLVPDEGAAVDCATGLPDVVLFHLEQLLLLQPIMKNIDLSRYPDPAPFFGHKIRGVIVGQRIVT